MSTRFGTSALRPPPGNSGPLGANRPPYQDRPELPERSAPSSAPFSGNQASPFGSPAKDPFGNSRPASPAPSPFGAAPTGGPDPFAGRSSLGQPFEQRPRSFGASGPQNGPLTGMPSSGASPFGSA